MAYRLRDCPWWVRAVLCGSYFGGVMGVFALAQGHPPGSALRTALIEGCLYGGVMGPVTAGRRRQERRGRTPAELQAIDSLLGGPAPEDPDLRDLARGVGEHRLASSSAWLIPIVTGTVAVALVVTGAFSSPWYWVLAAVVSVAGLWSWRRRAELAARVAQLRDDAPDPDPPHPNAGEDATQPATPGTLDDVSTHTGSWSPPQRP